MLSIKPVVDKGINSVTVKSIYLINVLKMFLQSDDIEIHVVKNMKQEEMPNIKKGHTINVPKRVI